ncbi:MAG: hypothetical protein ACLUD0_06415 [Eubacterium ramulus]
MTLLTCTPYGVNTQRLMVRGHRVPYEEQTVADEQTPPSWSVSFTYELFTLGYRGNRGDRHLSLYWLSREKKLQKRAAGKKGI